MESLTVELRSETDEDFLEEFTISWPGLESLTPDQVAIISLGLLAAYDWELSYSEFYYTTRMS